MEFDTFYLYFMEASVYVRNILLGVSMILFLLTEHGRKTEALKFRKMKLEKHIQKALDKFTEIYKGTFALTGSISLKCTGYIDRPIGDIDIVVPDLKAVDLALIKVGSFMESKGSSDIDEDDTTFNVRGGFELEGVDFCVIEDRKFKKILTLINGKTYRITVAKETIMAKKAFVKNYLDKPTLTRAQARILTKHMDDLIKCYQKHL